MFCLKLFFLLVFLSFLLFLSHQTGKTVATLFSRGLLLVDGLLGGEGVLLDGLDVLEAVLVERLDAGLEGVVLGLRGDG